MAAGNPARKAGVLAEHLGRRRPGRVLALHRDIGDAFPPALIARNGNRVAHGLTRPHDMIKPAITEADDDLTSAELGAEAHRVAATATVFVAAPQEEDLVIRGGAERRRGSGDGYASGHDCGQRDTAH